MTERLTYSSVTRQECEKWQGIFKVVLFIFWPFGSFLYSLKDASSKSSYCVFFAFGVLFSWHMNPNSSARYDDLIGIFERFYSYNYSLSELSDFVWNYITFSPDAEKEIVEICLITLIKSFTNNPHLYLAVASIFYLLFYLRSLKYITSDPKFTSSITCLIVLMLFVLPRDIISVQNPRYVIGVWINIYATLMVFQEKKYNYTLLVLITPAIHSGFWYYVIIFLLGFFTLKRQGLMIVLVYVSIPFSYLSYDIISAVDFSVLSLPDSIKRTLESYLSEDSFNKYNIQHGTGFTWLQVLFTSIRNTLYAIIPIILYREKTFIDTTKYRDLFSFYLFYVLTCNFIQFIPVLSDRAFFITRILGIYLFFKIIYPRKMYFLYMLLFSCSFEIIMRYFWKGAVYSSVPTSIFYSNTFSLIADYWDTPFR